MVIKTAQVKEVISTQKWARLRVSSYKAVWHSNRIICTDWISVAFPLLFILTQNEWKSQTAQSVYGYSADEFIWLTFEKLNHSNFEITPRNFMAF